MHTANHTVNRTDCENRPHVCWSAVFSGAFVGVGLGFLLHLLSIAIGLTAYSSTLDGAKVVAIGGILGLIIGVIISMGLAGYVTGYLGRFHHNHCHGGVIYGFLTWSIALLLSAVFVIPLTHYISLYTKDLVTPAAVITKPVREALGDTNTSMNNKAQKNDANANRQMNAAQEDRDTLAWSGWIVFLLFLIGAISSCVGACCGLKCRDEARYT